MRASRSLGLILAVLGAAACSDDTKSTTPPDARPPEAKVGDAKPGEKVAPDAAKPDTGPLPTEASSFVTFNAGLAAGAVPFSAERRPLIIDALKQVKADAVCLQEVWTDDDAKAFTDGLKAVFPFSFREKTEDTSTAQVRCTDLSLVLALKGCVDTNCTPKGISAETCVASTCATEYGKISDECKLCLAANTANPLPCAIGGAKDFVYEGRNGLLLLSRVDIKSPKYTAMDAVVIKRGVITASVGSLQVQCTQLPASFGAVPYPKGAKFASWAEEHAAAVTTLLGTAAGSCNVLAGDLNAGPAQGSLTGELAEDYKKITDGGYTEPWATPQCTWCKDNPLTGSTADKWIDHIMFKGCSKTPTYGRILDAEVTVTVDSKPQKTRLSDHYGLRVDVK